VIVRILLALSLIAGVNISSYAQDNPELTIEQILAKADSVSRINDSLRTQTTIRYKMNSVMDRLNSDGTVKESDTTIAIVTSRGDEEISRDVIYSSTGGEGKARKDEKRTSLSFADPAYNFSLTGSDSLSYKISVVPKASPPGEGEYVGTIDIDKERFYLRRFDFNVPDPEGALKEFAIGMDFEPLEGGLLVPVEMEMRGFVKALIGIIKVRFSGEFTFSEYEIIEK